jgi:PST family polysaccharide transporter
MSSIQATAVRGASWTISAGFATRILTLVASVVITHYVAKEALGDVGAAAIFMQTANSMTTLGMGQYLIAAKDHVKEETFHVVVLNMATVMTAVVVCYVARVPLGRFLNVADSALYLPWLMGTFVVDRVTFIPERLLIRRMEFRRIAISRSLGDLAYGVATIGFAMRGWGGWALIVGNVVRTLLRAMIIIPAVPLSEWLAPTALQRAVYQRIVRFGLPIAGQQLLLNASSRWDNLAFSYYFGDAPMAQYNVAYTLADVPADQVGEQIAEVMLPSFARMPQAERDAAVVDVTGLTAILIFPLSVGLGAVAPTLVSTILPPDWSETGWMLTILAALSLVRPLAWQANAYFIAVGTPRVGLLIDLVKLFLLFGSIVALSRFGQLWTCGAVGIAFGTALVLAWWAIAKKIGRPVWDFFAQCLPALAACGIMAAAVVGARWGFAKTGIHLKGVGLALEVIVGAIAYVGALPVVARKSTMRLVDLVKEAYRTRKGRRD